MTAILFGLALVFITAPFQAPDEPAHFLRIWQLSEGRLVADHYGGIVPTSLCDCYVQFLPMATHSEVRTRVGMIVREFHRPLEPSRRQYVLFANTAIYSPVPYLPQMIAVWVGRTCSLPPIALMYLGRCANALSYAMLGALTIRILPILKWTACFVLLAPLPLFLAGSLSADPMTTSLAFLTTASALRMLQRTGTARWNLIAVLAVATIGTALCKWAYLPVAILIVVIPRQAWGSKPRDRMIPAGILAMTFSAFLFWSALSRPMHVPLLNGDPQPQLHWLCSHPLEYVRVLFRTFLRESKTIPWTCIGVLGWLDTRLSPWFVGAYLLVTLWTGLADRGSMSISNAARLLAAVGVVCAILMIATCEYLVWNQTGNAVIEGIQGRYLLPLALLGVVVIRRESRAKLPVRLMAGIIWMSGAYALLAVMRRYY